MIALTIGVIAALLVFGITVACMAIDLLDEREELRCELAALRARRLMKVLA